MTDVSDQPADFVQDESQRKASSELLQPNVNTDDDTRQGTEQDDAALSNKDGPRPSPVEQKSEMVRPLLQGDHADSETGIKKANDQDYQTPQVSSQDNHENDDVAAQSSHDFLGASPSVSSDLTSPTVALSPSPASSDRNQTTINNSESEQDKEKDDGDVLYAPVDDEAEPSSSATPPAKRKESVSQTLQVQDQDASALSHDQWPFRLRRAGPHDLQQLAKLCQEAFNDYHRSANLPLNLDFPFLLMGNKMESVRGAAYVAVVTDASTGDERLLGGAFVDKSDDVALCGPFFVETKSQNQGIARRCIEAILEDCKSAGCKSLLAVNIACNPKSFGLFASLGFECKDGMVELAGFVNDTQMISWAQRQLQVERENKGGIKVRSMTKDDLDSTSSLFKWVNLWNRKYNLSQMCQASGHFPTFVAMQKGKIVGYSTGFFSGGHTVALNEEAFIGLLISASSSHQAAKLAPPTINILPRVYPALLRRVLSAGLRVSRQHWIMGIGGYHTPAVDHGIYCPTIEG